MLIDYLNIIPEQYTGREIKAEAIVNLNDTKDAKNLFYLASNRLLNVNNWHEIAGFISAVFKLTDSTGKEKQEFAVKGDFIKVDIPGPGSKEGNGYDWVIIEELKEFSKDEIESIGFTVRPVFNPTGTKDSIAHFYDQSSSSSFILTREEKKVTTNIIDRNIKPNDDTSSITDKFRHLVVGTGAIGAFSKLQWQRLAEAIIKI